MILQINDWKFHIFEVTTRKYYAKTLSDHCLCSWCRNFYASVDQKYPEIRPFLERFAVQVEAPDEMNAFTPTMLANHYMVCGSIMERGEESILIDGIPVEPLTAEEALVDTDFEGPCFFLSLGCMTLPWVLDEPMEEADSPSRRRNPIQRLLSRWIVEET